MNRAVLRPACAAVGFLALITLASRPALPKPRVPTVTVLGVVPPETLDGGAEVYALNQRGDMSGMTSVSGAGLRGVFYSKGTPTPVVLPTDGQDETWRAAGNNDRGDSVGATFSESGSGRAVLWPYRAIAPVVLPLVADGTTGEASDINSRGQVVGANLRIGLGFHAVTWDKKRKVSLLQEPVGAELSNALAISEKGAAVGLTSVGGASRGLYWKTVSSAPVVLQPASGDTGCQALALNNKGAVVGHSYSGNGSRAVLWAPGTTTASPLLAPPLVLSTTALSINDRGDVVGSAQLQDASFRAVLWPAGGGFPVDLTSLAPAGSGILIQQATAINNKRWIAANGTQDGKRRAFLIKL